ncbi:hypothetical protein GCM10028821_50890 [Hymenobacter jeollabukensis]
MGLISHYYQLMHLTSTQVFRRALFLGAALLGSAAGALAQGPAKQWDKGFGGSNSDVLYALQQTRDGGYILAGSSASPASGDKSQATAGALDYWVVKVDAQGLKQWERTLGGSGTDQLRALQQTSDGGYVLAGGSNSPVSGDKSQSSRGDYDFWVVKLDSLGAKQWDRTLGGLGYDLAWSVQQTFDGGYVLAGPIESGASGDKSEPTYSGGYTDGWVVKLDAQGTKQWDRTLGGNQPDELLTVRQTTDGGYITCGFSASGVSGTKSEPSRGSNDMWLVKLSGQGVKLWDRTYGGSSFDHAVTVEQASDGGFLLGGDTQSGIGGDKTETSRGARDYWVVRTDAQGVKLWDRTLGGPYIDYGMAARLTPDGGCLMAGYSISGAGGDKTEGQRGGSDYWLVKLSAQGQKQWDQTLGGTEQDVLYAAQQTRDGGFIVGGGAVSGQNGDKSQPSNGGVDYWIVKLGVVTAAQPPRTFTPPALYPNPAHTRLTVRLAPDAPPAALQLRLHDAKGRVRLTLPVAARQTDVPVELGPLPAGLYLLRVEGPGGYAATQRLVVE